MITKDDGEQREGVLSGAEGSPAIACKGVSKVYGDGTVALKGLDL